MSVEIELEITYDIACMTWNESTTILMCPVYEHGVFVALKLLIGFVSHEGVMYLLIEVCTYSFIILRID